MTPRLEQWRPLPALYGNAATSMIEGGNPLNPVSFVVPTLEKAYDAATGKAREEALKMIGENAELAEVAEQDLLNQRRKLKKLEQQFKQSGGQRPKLTDTACNNMDAWLWKE